MARVWSCGFELNSTTAGMEFDSLTGTGSIVTSPVRSGTYALRLNPSAAAGGIQYTYAATDQTKIYYFRFWINITSITTGTVQLFTIDDSGGADDLVGFNILSSRVLQLRDFFNGVQIGSNSSALATGIWIRIELKVDTTTVSSTVVEGKINGTVFASGTIDLTGIAGQSLMILGPLATTTMDISFDDVAINDSTGSFQNNYPGDGKIIHLNPNAAGDNNAFTVQVGGTAGSTNNFTRVNEIPPNDLTSYNGDITNGDIDDFNVTDVTGTLGIRDGINVVAVGVRYAGLSAVSDASFKVRIKKAASGTVSTGTAITPASTSFFTNANSVPKNPTLTLYQDPDNNNWSLTTLNSAQIGYTITTSGVNAAIITNIWLLVEYVPSNIGYKSLLGVGV